MPDPSRPCSKCGEQPAGPGGVLCPGCAAEIEARLDAYRHRAGDTDKGAPAE